MKEMIERVCRLSGEKSNNFDQSLSDWRQNFYPKLDLESHLLTLNER